LIGGALIVSAAVALLLRQSPVGRVGIYQNGVLIRTLDLSEIIEPYSFEVESEAGKNVIAVEQGRVCILDADCPDGSCIRQGWISGGATPRVCLPHRLVIKPDGNHQSPAGDGLAPAQSPNVDAVVG
jgi:hypothetical protein